MTASTTSPTTTSKKAAPTTASQTLKRKLGTLPLLFLLTIPLLLSLSFISNPQFNSGSLVYTDDTLTCAWTYSGDTTAQNITINRDGSFFANRYETGSPLNTSYAINSVNTTKNEDWECVIELDNGTATTSNTATVSIQNSAPETPTIYNSSDDNIGTTYTVLEDTAYVFDVNSSDADDDTLTYYFKAGTQGFCVMTTPATGIATCTPEEADHNGSPTNQNITFWVDDDDSSFAKSASKTVTFTVTPVNDAPIINPANQTTPVNATLTYDFSGTDEEGDSPLTFTLVNTPAEIAPKVSLTAIDNDTARFIYNATPPDFNDVNNTGWLLTVNVSDANNASSLANFYLNITAVGRAPEITSYNPSNSTYWLAQGDSIQINITANDSDGNDTHTYLDDSSKTTFNTTTTQTNVNVTGNTTGQIDFLATNDDVGSFSVTITVQDAELLTDEITLNFTVTNVNDAPTIYELSNFTNNTNENTNTSNVTAYADAPFSFQINASDIDEQHGDTLTYTDNSSLFTINNATGVISFTPNSANVSATPYSINITVTDNGSLTDSRILTLYILNNTAPYFSPDPPPNASCLEGSACTYDIASYAFEDDAGDSIVSYQVTSNLSLSYNQTTGLINFTPNQSQIGNHTLVLNITDERGATTQTNITLEINNTPEAPVLVRYDFSTAMIVEDHLFTYQLQAQDNDLLASIGENLTFATNISFANIDTYTTGGNQTNAMLSMTPNSSHVGSQTINVTVTDADGLSDSQIFTFTILADSDSPVISLVQPYGNASNSNSPVESYNTTSLGTSTTLSFAENNTYLFAHITTDDLTATDDLNTTWYYDGVQVATTWNYTRAFNFSSSGTHTLLLVVNDSMLDASNFTWDMTISNLNRAPLLLNDLENITNITTTYSFPNYLGNHDSTQFYIDPDDDVNGNNEIDGSETDALTYTVTTCTSGSDTIATIAITNDDVVITPVNEGSCTVIFTATDASSATLQSNVVLLNVTEQPEGVEETVTTTSSSGGGGSTTRSSFIPLTRETEKPQAINIIAPKIVTVYENNSVIIPFEVKNTWTDSLDFIQLSASSNSSTITTALSSNLIERLQPNETAELFLQVNNYRLGNNYEVELIANVSSPSFEDSAVILLTSIEQSGDGDDVDVKVTFARDLFNEHPECQELNELLDRATEELAKQNYVEAERYVDTAINGCKYIVSTLQQRTERPNAIPSLITLKEATLSTILFTALAVLILSTIAFIIYYHYTSKEEDDI